MGTCPTFTDEELLIIFDCNPDIFHRLETKLCIMYSFNQQSYNRRDSQGRDVTETQPTCGSLTQTQLCPHI